MGKEDLRVPKLGPGMILAECVIAPLSGPPQKKSIKVVGPQVLLWVNEEEVPKAQQYGAQADDRYPEAWTAANLHSLSGS